MIQPVTEKRSRTRALIVGVAILCVAALPLTWFAFAWNERVADATCRNNLRQIGLALRQYHEVFGAFPPAYVMNGSGQRCHSWRVLILPFLGHEFLYKQYRFDEPWDSSHNRELLKQMPAVYRCSAVNQKGFTNYVAIVGPQTAWPEYLSMTYPRFRDGTSNTLQLIEAANLRIPWTEPRDLDYKEIRKSGRVHLSGQGAKHFDATRILLADGSVRTLPRQLDDNAFFALCTADSGHPFPGANWELPTSDVEEFEREPRPAREFPRTDVVPHLRVPLVSGRNTVYCATFQLAWDGLRDQVVKGPVKLSGDAGLSEALNANHFPRSSLSEGDYVAVAGLISDGILGRIRSEMLQKFPATAPRLVPESRGFGIVAYAFLQKRLPFELSFDRLTKPLSIREGNGKTNVFSFGIQHAASHAPREKALRSQVIVSDYVNDDDFVIRLATPRGIIVLAKIQRNATLGETLANARARVNRPLGRAVRSELDIAEPIAVPLLSLFVEREYEELIGRVLQNKGFAELPIVSAQQLIHFQLDESGAMLESEAEMSFLDGDEPPAHPRHFVFDQPFLIYLQASPSLEPYFVMWVENPELMVPFDR